MTAPGEQAFRVPALAVTRAETKWKVTFDDPPTNLVDPEMILELQALVDSARLPADADLVSSYETFFDSAARLAA